MRVRPGQTIMELLAAFAVITVGLLGVVQLVYSNLSLVERDADAVVSVNLAREGIELAKQKRDSNWLAGKAFDDEMFFGTDYTATPVWDGVLVPSVPIFSFAANDMTDDHADIVRTTTGLFANWAAAEAGIQGQATPYKRLLTFDPICDDFTIVTSGAACASRKIGMRVTSKIQWTRKGNAKAFQMVEDIYDWR